MSIEQEESIIKAGKEHALAERGILTPDTAKALDDLVRDITATTDFIINDPGRAAIAAGKALLK